MADKSKLGTEFPTFSFEIEKGKIAEFAMAISQKDSKEQVDQIYVDQKAAKDEGYDDIVVPPTFQTCFSLWGSGGLMPMITALGINLGRLLHGEEEYEYFKPIHPGDVITCKTKVTDMYDKEKKKKPGTFMEFTVLKTEMTNQKGELVIKASTTLVER